MIGSIAKRIGVLLVFVSMSACMGPFKEQTDSERQVMLSKLSGLYRVVDTRTNISKATSISLLLSESRGFISFTGENGVERNFRLRNCKTANKSQAGNLGSPVESIEDVVRCNVEGYDYEHSRVFIAKVKSDYIVESQALIKRFGPIAIKSGYVIDFLPDRGSYFIVDAERGNQTQRLRPMPKDSEFSGFGLW
jgi:hypothetical protein